MEASVTPSTPATQLPAAAPHPVACEKGSSAPLPLESWKPSLPRRRHPHVGKTGLAVTFQSGSRAAQMLLCPANNHCLAERDTQSPHLGHQPL